MEQHYTEPKPHLARTLWRGLCRTCPNCGNGRTLHSYLKVHAACENCGEQLGHIRADDFPPYLTIVIVGHIVVPLLLLSEKFYAPPSWFQMTFWPAFSLVFLLALLPICKGFCVNLMWHIGLKGDEH